MIKLLFDSAGVARATIRGIEFKTVLIPVVQFNYGQIALDKKGQQTIGPVKNVVCPLFMILKKNFREP